MKKILYTISFLILFATIGFSQERVTFSGTISVNELNTAAIDNIQNKRTVDAGVRFNFLKSESKWIFGPAFSYQRQYGVQVTPTDVERDIDYFYGGAELARKAGKFRFGGGFYLGTTQLYDNSDYKLVRKYRGFADLQVTDNLGLRLFQAELQASGNFNIDNLLSPNRSTNYGAGVTLSF